MVLTIRKKSKALVVRPKAGKSTSKPKSAATSPLVVYKAALADPFSTLAQGARVPDMYSVPTATRHITRKFTLSSNASGECDVVVLPSAFYHALSPRGSIVGGNSWLTLDGATVTNAAVLTTTSALSPQLINYRIVGYGVKVIGIASMTTNSGSLTIATVPVDGYQNTKDTIGGQASNSANASATVANTLTSWGVPNASSVVSVSSLPSLPNTLETSMINVSERPISVSPKICAPCAFDFKLSSDIGPGYNITSQTSAVSVSAGNASFMRVGGHEAVILAATGCPASTSMLDIEIIYHLEGTPFISATANQVVGSDSSNIVCDPVGWMNVVRDVAATPSFKTVAVAAANTFFPGLGTAVGRYL